MRLISLFITVLMVSSCATHLTTLDKDQDVELKAGQGYLLLAVETNRHIKGISISGPQNLKLNSKDLRKGTNYMLVDLEAGKYTINSVSLENFLYMSMDEEYWQFEVLPNQISYVGHIEIVRRDHWRIVYSSELVNRSSEALEFLEEEYPNILASRSIAYGGPGNDNFFKFLASKIKE